MTRPVRPPSPVVRKPPLRHRLHRTAGVATGLVLLYLIATGVPLQLTHPLDLGGRYVENALVLDWYGIGAPQSGWRSDDVRFVGGLVFVNERQVAEADEFQGAVASDGLLVIAAGATLLLIDTRQPGIVESLSVPAPVARIGRAATRVIVDTPEGLRWLHPESLELLPAVGESDDVRWAPLESLTGAALAPYRDAVRGRVLTLERLLQDLHSGRAFGPVGEWLVTVSTLVLAVLAVSGFWIWWRSR